MLPSSKYSVMSLSYWDQTLWGVNIIIKNLDLKTQYSQTCSDILLLGSILVVYEWSDNGKNKNKDLKAKIYHLALKTMLKSNYSSSKYI